MQVQNRIDLLIIDPPNDFCDFPASELPSADLCAASSVRPALPVAGANADMCRLAAFLRRVGGKLRRIHVTLDSHHPVHIASPAWWSSPDGVAPDAFTTISAQDMRSGRWRARNPAWQDRTLAYLAALAQSARYALVVWPEHCLIGHWGHNVHSRAGPGARCLGALHLQACRLHSQRVQPIHGTLFRGPGRSAGPI